MIVLDTNVVSELMRQVPDDSVVRWVDRHPYGEVFTTVVTAAELAFGVARLPDGRRKALLESRVSALLTEDFEDQILPFDSVAAEHYAQIAAARENGGRPMSTADAQVAAICRRYAASLATRNVKDFADTGVEVLNPWGDGNQPAQ